MHINLKTICKKRSRVLMTFFTAGQPVFLEAQMRLLAVIVDFSRLNIKWMR